MEKEELFNFIAQKFELDNCLNKKIANFDQFQIHEIASGINQKVYFSNFSDYPIRIFELALFIQDKENLIFAINKNEGLSTISQINKQDIIENFILKLIEVLSIEYIEITEEYRADKNNRRIKIKNVIQYVKENSPVISDIKIMDFQDDLPIDYVFKVDVTWLNEEESTISFTKTRRYFLYPNELTIDYDEYFDLDIDILNTKLLTRIKDIYYSLFYTKPNFKANSEQKDVYTLFDTISKFNLGKMQDNLYIIPMLFFEDDVVFEEISKTLPYILKKLWRIKNIRLREDIMKNIPISQDFEDYFIGSDEILLMSFEEIDRYIQNMINEYIKILNISLNPFISELELRNFHEKYSSEIITIQELFSETKNQNSLSKYKVIINLTSKQKRKFCFENTTLISENRFSKIKKHFIQ